MPTLVAKTNHRLMLPFSALLHHFSLTSELSKRDVLGRYRGASFGLLWSLISPFLMLMVYTFAFGTIMKGRWPQIEAGHTQFSIILFAGLIVHGFFNDIIRRIGVPEIETRLLAQVERELELVHGTTRTAGHL